MAQWGHGRVDLGPEPAPALAQRLGRLTAGAVRFFFAPAAAPVARTQLLSTLSHSVSSSRRAAAIFCQTPLWHQRLYRCHRLLGLPKWVGRSAQAMPVLAR